MLVIYLRKRGIVSSFECSDPPLFIIRLMMKMKVGTLDLSLA